LAPTVGIAATGFCHPGGILHLFHRQDQQILRLQQQPDCFKRSHLIGSSSSAKSTSTIVYSIKIFNASPSGIVEFIQIQGPQDKSGKSMRMQHRFDDSSNQDITSPGRFSSGDSSERC
jgi:hypothetical protein